MLFRSYHSGAVKGAPVARDGAVFFSTTSGWIHALDEETGEKLGERHLGGALAPSGPVIVDDVLVVGSQDGSVYLTPLAEILDTPLAEGVDVPLSESIEDDASAGTTVLLVALSALVLALLAVVHRFQRAPAEPRTPTSSAYKFGPLQPLRADRKSVV